METNLTVNPTGFEVVQTDLMAEAERRCPELVKRYRAVDDQIAKAIKEDKPFKVYSPLYDEQDDIFKQMYNTVFAPGRKLRTKTLWEVLEQIESHLENAKEVADYTEARKWGLKKAAIYRALNKTGLSLEVEFTSLGFTGDTH